MDNLSRMARTAAVSSDHWQTFFETIRQEYKVDRMCAAVQLDPYTAYLPRVAQVSDLEPYLGGVGLYADREISRTFDVISKGQPYLATPEDWINQPDLAFYSVAVKSNMKFPISLGGHPTVLNLWSKAENAFTVDHIDQLESVANDVGRSAFKLELAPVGLAMREAKNLMISRANLSAN